MKRARTSIAAALIGAVSAWLAAQPVPAHATAPAAAPKPLPIACGGVAAAAGAASGPTR